MSSKLLKSELKEIVKECLVEILTEGILSPGSEFSKRDALNERRKTFDHVKWASENREEKPRINHLENARALTDNPILAEVLADSQRTMNEQINAERRGPVAGSGDYAQRKIAQSDPMDIFEGSDNWAALAFSGN